MSIVVGHIVLPPWAYVDGQVRFIIAVAYSTGSIRLLADRWPGLAPRFGESAGCLLQIQAPLLHPAAHVNHCLLHP